MYTVCYIMCMQLVVVLAEYQRLRKFTKKMFSFIVILIYLTSWLIGTQANTYCDVKLLIILLAAFD